MQPGPEAAVQPVSNWAFLQSFFHDRKTIGAVAPTSRGVARRMAKLAGISRARTVAEFGPGTGPITREILAALPPDGRLWAFEVYEPFVEHLRATFTDPRLTVLGESAAAVTQLREAEFPGGLDAIVSSVPFSLLGPETTRAILRAAVESLRPGGVFIALQYHPWYLAPYLHEQFQRVQRRVYPWNIPPALLIRARFPWDAP